MTTEIEILGQNFAHIDRFEGSFLTIFWVKKVVFSTFSKFFWNFLGSFLTLFSALKGLLLGVFTPLKVDK